MLLTESITVLQNSANWTGRSHL